MKIAFAGGSGTGKTTLAEAYAQHRGIPSIPEFARDILVEWGLDSPGDLTPEQGVYYSQEILRRKIQAEDASSSFVSDRSSIDHAALWFRWNTDESIVEPSVTQEFIEKCISRANVYDHIFLLKVGDIPYEKDGVRGSYAFQLGIEATIVGILVLHRIPFTILPSAVNTVEKRIRYLDYLYP